MFAAFSTKFSTERYKIFIVFVRKDITFIINIQINAIVGEKK